MAEVPRYERQRSGIAAKLFGWIVAALALVAVNSLVFRYLSQYGVSNIWNVDGAVQHFPAYMYCRQIIQAVLQDPRHGFPMWSFHLGLGADTIGILPYYIGDPFGLIGLAFPVKMLEHAYLLEYYARLVAAGLAGYAYLRSMRASSLGAIAGSIVYVFSTYGVLAALRHPYFADPLVWFPLILLGVEHALHRKRPYVLVIGVLLAGVASYYFLYMMTPFVIIYAVIRYFEVSEKGRRLIGFVPAVLWVGGLFALGLACAAFMLWPGLDAFFTSSRAGLVQQIPRFYDIQTYRSYFAAFVSVNGGVASASLGYSVLTLLALPVLYMRWRRNAALKIMNVVYALTLVFPWVGAAFNGFAFPSYRFLFMWGLFLGAAVAEMLSDRRALSIPELLVSLVWLAWWFAVTAVASWRFDVVVITPFALGGAMWLMFALERIVASVRWWLLRWREARAARVAAGQPEPGDVAELPEAEPAESVAAEGLAGAPDESVAAEGAEAPGESVTAAIPVVQACVESPTEPLNEPLAAEDPEPSDESSDEPIAAPRSAEPVADEDATEPATVVEPVAAVDATDEPAAADESSDQPPTGTSPSEEPASEPLGERSEPDPAPDTARHAWRPISAILRFIVVVLMVVNIATWATFTFDPKFDSRLETYVPAGVTVEAYTSEPGTVVHELPGAATSRIDRQDSAFGSDLLTGSSNDAMVMGYNGISEYYSVMDGDLHDYLNGLDVRPQRDAFEYDGFDDRAALEMLAGVRYFLPEGRTTQYVPYGFTIHSQIATAPVYENRYALPIGFVYHSIVPSETYAALPPLEKQQALLQGVVLGSDTNVDLPRITPSREVTDVPYSVTVTGTTTFDQVTGTFTPGVEEARATLHFKPVPNSELYMDMTGISFDLAAVESSEPGPSEAFSPEIAEIPTGEWTADLPLLVSMGTVGPSKWERQESPSNDHYWGDTSVLTNLGYFPNGTDQAYVRVREDATVHFTGLHVYAIPMGGFASRYATLAADGMTGVQIGQDSVSGSVTSHGAGLLFFSIPYSRGWHATVDGQPARVVRANVGFIGVPVTNGPHSVELRYVTPVMPIALPISEVGFALLAMLIVGWEVFAIVRWFRRRWPPKSVPVPEEPGPAPEEPASAAEEPGPAPEGGASAPAESEPVPEEAPSAPAESEPTPEE